jgi:hypothetical protein
MLDPGHGTTIERQSGTSLDVFPRLNAGDEGQLWNGPEST